jgi:multidrug resistance protein
VLWSTVALDLIGFGIAIPVLSLFAEKQFGASAAASGALFATFSLAQFVVAPLMGRLSDRIGRKPVILLSLFGTAAGSLLTGAAVGLWMLFLGRLIDGASGASVAVAQAAATDLAEPRDRPRVLGLLGAAFGLGFTIGPAIGGVAAWLGGRRAPFLVAGVLALINGLVAIRRLPETRARTAATPAPAVPSRRRRIGTIPEMRRLLGVAFLATAAFSAFEATFSLLADHRLGLDEAAVAWVFVGVGVGSSVIQGGGVGPLTERFGSATLMRVGVLSNAAGLAVLAAAEHWPLMVVALLLLVIGQGLLAPSISATVANRAGDRRGRALGEQQSVGSLARVVGPAVGGVLFGLAVPLPYIVAATLMALAFVVLVGDR